MKFVLWHIETPCSITSISSRIRWYWMWEVELGSFACLQPKLEQRKSLGWVWALCACKCQPFVQNCSWVFKGIMDCLVWIREPAHTRSYWAFVMFPYNLDLFWSFALQIECSSISDYAVKIVKANKLDHSKKLLPDCCGGAGVINTSLQNVLLAGLI